MAPSRFLQPIALLILGVLLLSLSFAPMGQFYLAWIGLVPWLIVVARCKSQKSVFWWSWLGGTLFFIANMWWLAAVTLPGMIALMIYCGLYWPLAGLVIRGARLLEAGAFGVFSIATIWTASEWLRGHVITGMPLFYLGHSQTPILAMCQVADLGGAYAVTFWVATINALGAMYWLNRTNWRPLLPAASRVVGLVLCVFVYGLWRIGQTPASLHAGPTVAVIQPNYPQTNSGQKGASLDDRLRFHLDQTNAALAKAGGKVDLVVWSETMMPPINLEARQEFTDTARLYDILSGTAAQRHVAMLIGAEYSADFADEVRDGQTYRIGRDNRNSAFLFDASGRMDDSLGKRYDKIHLLPFGEFIPFKESLPFLYRIFLSLGPQYYSDYELQPGDKDERTVFELPMGVGQTDRFVTPICFEDLDADLVAAMFRPTDGSDRKRADFVVNITNDGWFQGNENWDHLQAGIFRCIENRVPTARSVNTGISGFIDSTGRTSHLLPVRTSGFAVGQLILDDRLTIYTRGGDFFADLCVVLSAGIAWAAWLRRQGARTSS
ncbi:MAG: apolipoprotein N-acyltransferase [Tepidisphaeraceae bacterium]